MADVKVVAPFNVGKGIIWNDSTKKYEVNIGDGLEINSEGKVVVKKVQPISSFDNGTGQQVFNSTIIDYGNGIIEFSGVVEVNCAGQIGNNVVTNPPFKDMEGVAKVDLSQFNFKQIISVHATAGDQRLTGTAHENAWVIGVASGEAIRTDAVYIGGQIVGDPSKPILPVFFTVKGIKA